MDASGFAPIVRDIVVNMGDDNYCYEIAPQGDGRNRYLNMTLMVDGSPYIIASGSTAIFEGTNAGGYAIFNPCTIISENVIQVSLGNGVLSFPGQCQFRVSIYSEGSSTSGFNLYLFVTEAPYNVVELQASDAYEALTDLVNKANEAIGVGTLILDGTVVSTADSYCYIWMDSTNLDVNEDYEVSVFASKFGAIFNKFEIKINPTTSVASLYIEFPKEYVGMNVRAKLNKV